jgi:hypothetical protein
LASLNSCAMARGMMPRDDVTHSGMVSGLGLKNMHSHVPFGVVQCWYVKCLCLGIVGDILGCRMCLARPIQVARDKARKQTRLSCGERWRIIPSEGCPRFSVDVEAVPMVYVFPEDV